MFQRALQYLFVVAFITLLLSSCEREFSFENGGTPGAGSVSGTSQFTFGGAGGNCTGADVNGLFFVGTASGAGNTVDIDVNVTVAGTYNVTTASQGGISFSGSGTFTGTGAQTITLTASGTPSSAGTYTFTAGGVGCNFSVTIYPAIPTFSGTFTAKVNGTATTFNVIQATLIRSVSTNEKRFDLSGVSTDGSKRISIVIGNSSSSSGNNVELGDHPIQLFLDDDPATPQDESELSDSFIILATSLGSGSWLTDVYKVSGTIQVGANTPGVTTGTISGTFNATLKDMSTDEVKYSFTEGEFNNITYYVLN